MNVSAKLVGADQVFGSLKNFGNGIASPAADSVVDALAATISEARQASGLDQSLEKSGKGARRALGASDLHSILREFGSLEQNAMPWLAPSLPAALGPMRAAAAAAVARAISALRNSR